VRCSAECVPDTWPLPRLGGEAWPRERRITPEELARLACPRCGAPGRPHVLWFDESYDEVRYRFESSVRAAASADVFVVVGTTGTTGLPQIAARTAARAGALLISVDPESDPFAEWFERRVRIAEAAGAAVPGLVATLSGACA
jgi:NAD-dependent deacetylase